MLLPLSCRPRQVLVTPTPDLGKVLNAMQELKIEGDINLATAVQVRRRWQRRSRSLCAAGAAAEWSCCWHCVSVACCICQGSC